MPILDERLHWSDVDSVVAGPYRSAAAPSVPFFVPSEPPGSFEFARLEPGAAWPAGLPPLDRVAVMPGTVPGGGVGDASHAVLRARRADGTTATICARRDGEVVWAVDPRHWIRAVLDERYVARWRRPLPSRLPLLDYTRLPPALLGLVQRLQASPSPIEPDDSGFPSLPLDDLVDQLRALCATLATGERVMPAPWPDACEAAMTVTHDIDTDWILRPAQWRLFCEIVDTETQLGFRGAWYVTGKRLDRRRHARAVEYLIARGHEIGAHGWSHDGKLAFRSITRQEAEMARAAACIAGFAGCGVRTPWYARSPALFDVLARHFRYDASVPTASGFFSDGTNSGCCTLFPYRTAGGLWVLPMTLPTDAFSDLDAGYRLLRTLVEVVRARRGVIVTVLHPQPHQSGNAHGLAAYFAFLEDVAARHAAALWHATPAEIVACYRAAVGA